jgi:hypothetical protein
MSFFRRGLSPRPLNPSADTALPLYVQEPGARVTKSGETLVVETEAGKTEVAIGDIGFTDDACHRCSAARRNSNHLGFVWWLGCSVTLSRPVIATSQFGLRNTMPHSTKGAASFLPAAWWQQRFVTAACSFVHSRDDHVLVLDLGQADKVDLHVESLGKTFKAATRTAIVI